MGKRRHRKYRPHYYSQRFNQVNCDFCNKDLEGLPHKCKYCGRVHCSEHLLPESHNCTGLKQPQSFWEWITGKDVEEDEEEWPEPAPIKPQRRIKIPPVREPIIEPRPVPQKNRKPTMIFFLIFLIISVMLIIYITSKNQAETKHSLTISLEAMNFLNTIRSNDNLSVLKWDSKSYNLATFLSKQVSNEKPIQNISEKAEMFGLKNISFLRGYPQNLTNDSMQKMIKEWLQISNYKEEVLNGNYSRGAIGCYGRVCYLVILREQKKHLWSNFNLSSYYSSDNTSEDLATSDVTHFTESEREPGNGGFFSDIESFISGPEIDGSWVKNFMQIVNDERSNAGMSTLQESTQLSTIAEVRFNKMMENPFISHYGADEYNVGEVIFYPEGFTEQSYVEDLKVSARLHWDLLMDPMFSIYGYHIEEGPTILIWGSCSTTEITGPNIDVKEFFKERGCETTVGDSTWLVIDLS